MGGTNTPRWKVYYDDHSTFTSEDGPPTHAPPDGILWILFDHAEYGPQLIFGADYYMWVGDRWNAMYLNDLERHLRRLVPELKYARTTSDEKWKQAWAEALKEQHSWQ